MASLTDEEISRKYPFVYYLIEKNGPIINGLDYKNRPTSLIFNYNNLGELKKTWREVYSLEVDLFGRVVVMDYEDPIEEMLNKARKVLYNDFKRGE